MSKVFVSYKRDDVDKVLPIVRWLESELGFKLWIDLDGIENGRQFTSVIINAINECKVFLFMYSKTHEIIKDTENDYTVRELNFAQIRHKRIVFIDVEGAILPDWFIFNFPQWQVTQASDNRAMVKLIADIRRWLRLPQPNLSPSHSEKTTDKVSIPTENSSHPQTEITAADKPHPQAIDLGLPSGTKWASCNVGATRPEEYGGYYAWGETEEKDVYTWQTYIHCDGDKVSCHDIGSDISGSKYDVAYVKWGGIWRMPTLGQINELLDNCSSEWTSLNGIKGRKFTSKRNGNSIFLPATFDHAYDDFYDTRYYGNYWLSTQHSSVFEYANFLYFFSGGADSFGSSTRYYGYTVRPVTK